LDAKKTLAHTTTAAASPSPTAKMAAAEMRQRARNVKIAEYEKFIGERLAPDLSSAEVAKSKAQAAIETWEGLITNVRGVQEQGQEELRTMGRVVALTPGGGHWIGYYMDYAGCHHLVSAPVRPTRVALTPGCQISLHGPYRLLPLVV
jgi:hypothetical protein